MVLNSLATRTEILRRYFENHGYDAECVRKLRTKKGREEAPSAPYVRYFVKKVKESRFLIDKPTREKLQTVRTPYPIESLLLPKVCVKRQEQQFTVVLNNWAFRRQILRKDLGMTPYKVQLVQQLKSTNHPMRFRFASLVQFGLEENADFDKKKNHIFRCSSFPTRRVC